MPRNPRILQLYNRVPYPLRDGGVKAVWHTRQVLEDLGCEVRAFVLNPSRNRINPSNIPDSMRDHYLTEIVDVDSTIKAAEALAVLFAHLPYHLLRFESSDAARKLSQIMESYSPDLVLLEGLPMAIFQKALRQYDCQIWYRAHNIESDIIRQKAESFACWNPLKLWMQGEYRKMKAFESHTARTVDAVLAISPVDLSHLQAMAPERKDAMLHLGYWPGVVSTAEPLAKAKQPAWNGARPLKLGFIGTMDWLPNQDAVHCLLNEWIPATEAWPNRPEFHIAGRQAPAYFAQKRPAYFFHGEVEDAEAFMSSCDAMVFPLRMGSGLKIKALEAMALGIPVISTAQGVQGMDLTDGENYLHAESAGQFAEVLKDLYQFPNKLYILAENALRKFHDHNAKTQQIMALDNMLRQSFSVDHQSKQAKA